MLLPSNIEHPHLFTKSCQAYLPIFNFKECSLNPLVTNVHLVIFFIIPSFDVEQVQVNVFRDHVSFRNKKIVIARRKCAVRAWPREETDCVFHFSELTWILMESPSSECVLRFPALQRKLNLWTHTALITSFERKTLTLTLPDMDNLVCVKETVDNSIRYIL